MGGGGQHFTGNREPAGAPRVECEGAVGQPMAERPAGPGWLSVLFYREWLLMSNGMRAENSRQRTTAACRRSTGA